MRLFKERPDKRDPGEMFAIAYPNILRLYGPQPERDPEELPPPEKEMPREVPPNIDAQAEADWKRIMTLPSSSR